MKTIAIAMQAVQRVMGEQMSQEEQRFLSLVVQRLITPHSTTMCATPSDGQIDVARKAAWGPQPGHNIRVYNAAMACYWADPAHANRRRTMRFASRVTEKREPACKS